MVGYEFEMKKELWHVFNRGEMLLDDDRAEQTIDEAFDEIMNIMEKWGWLR